MAKVFLVDIWFPDIQTPEEGEFRTVQVTSDIEDAKMAIAGKFGLITPVTVGEVYPDGFACEARKQAAKAIKDGTAKISEPPVRPDLGKDLEDLLGPMPQDETK